ncbi:hypothetical protein T11_12452 [Trichinella zimbabwensis]|uniref:Uncharacterized protein n=1 Tax=Trichinella zimbabwensis TaxID=268475 RepID=A0A0V1I569_9BILA|nr:hypothetical protein T11_12452 [Trichinella zimbabwensis]
MNHGHYESKIVDRCLSDVDDRKREKEMQEEQQQQKARRGKSRPDTHWPANQSVVKLRIRHLANEKSVSPRETMAKSRAEQVDRTADFTSIQQPVH